MTRNDNVDYGFDTYVSEEVLSGISKAFLDLYNSIHENSTRYTKRMDYFGVKLITLTAERLKNILNEFIDLQCQMYCDLFNALSKTKTLGKRGDESGGIHKSLK